MLLYPSRRHPQAPEHIAAYTPHGAHNTQLKTHGRMSRRRILGLPTFLSWHFWLVSRDEHPSTCSFWYLFFLVQLVLATMGLELAGHLKCSELFCFWLTRRLDWEFTRRVSRLLQQVATLWISLGLPSPHCWIPLCTQKIITTTAEIAQVTTISANSDNTLVTSLHRLWRKSERRVSSPSKEGCTIKDEIKITEGMRFYCVGSSAHTL